MPILNTNGPDCYMVSYQKVLDPTGNPSFSELADPAASGVASNLMSDYLVNLIQGRLNQWNAFTDVFILNHGFWKSEADAASDFTAWINGVLAQAAANPLKVRFCPLIVATHWPSNPLPWSAGAPQIPSSTGSSLIDDALSKLVNFANGASPGSLLTDVVVDALNDAMADAERQAGAATGTLPRLDVTKALEDVIEWAWLLVSTWPAANDVFVSLWDCFVKPVFDVLLRSTFVDYGELAGLFGLTSVRGLAAKLLTADGGGGLRFHMMGHSLGAGVTAGALTGQAGSPGISTFSSVFLAQGAISTWSFASEVPMAGNLAGMYCPALTIPGTADLAVATQSLCDFMVRYPYPDAAQWAGWSGTAETVTSGQSSDYQGIGVGGIKGPLAGSAQPQPFPAIGGTMTRYGVYNVDATAFINGHSDIYNPTIAALYWNTVTASIGG